MWDDGIAVWTNQLDFRVGLWVSLCTLVMRVETRICLYVRCRYVCPILIENETARKLLVKCPSINFRFVLKLYAYRQTEGQMDGQTDGGILIGAPRRCDHTQNYVIDGEWTAVDT